jgi:hypothetical protein
MGVFRFNSRYPSFGLGPKHPDQWLPYLVFIVFSTVFTSYVTHGGIVIVGNVVRHGTYRYSTSTCSQILMHDRIHPLPSCPGIRVHTSYAPAIDPPSTHSLYLHHPTDIIWSRTIAKIESCL